MVLTVSGTFRMRSAAAVTIPKVPSLPTKTPPSGQGPRDKHSLPSQPRSSPSGSTTSKPSTWLVVTPYLKQCGPAFSAMLPPTDEALHTGWIGSVVVAVGSKGG